MNNDMISLRKTTFLYYKICQVFKNFQCLKNITYKVTSINKLKVMRDNTMYEHKE